MILCGKKANKDISALDQLLSFSFILRKFEFNEQTRTISKKRAGRADDRKKTTQPARTKYLKKNK